MPAIEISETLDHSLQLAAERRSYAKEDLIRDVLSSFIEEENQPEPHLTDAQMERMRQSLEQAKRCELIDGEVVMSRLQRFIQEIEAR